MIEIAIIIVTFTATMALTHFVRGWLLKRAVLDMPNDRSSHSIPTPRGGGWALVLALVPGIIAAALYHGAVAQMAPLLTALALLIGVSWLDDRHGVGAGLRLALHLCAAGLGTLALPAHATLFGDVLPFWLDRALMVVGWAWFINLYNFMDGIDGITGVETISIATGVCLVITMAGVDAPMVDTLTLLLTGAALGFLAFNWHPAKIFMGDVGSIPLGFLVGYCLLTLAAAGQVVPALILPLYYLADSGYTIAKRAMRGEKIWQAHREHMYQRAAMGLGRHDGVVLAIILTNLGLMGAALWAVQSWWMGGVLALANIAILARWMHKVSVQ